eukprot:s1938_g1.t1
MEDVSNVLEKGIPGVNVLPEKEMSRVNRKVIQKKKQMRVREKALKADQMRKPFAARPVVDLSPVASLVHAARPRPTLSGSQASEGVFLLAHFGATCGPGDPAGRRRRSHNCSDLGTMPSLELDPAPWISVHFTKEAIDVKLNKAGIAEKRL